MAIIGLQNIHVVARDVDAIAGFWEHAIGMTRKFRDGDRWIQLTAGAQPFAIASVEEGVPEQLGAVPVFEVAQLGATSEAIRRNGGRLLGERDMGSHGRVFTFADPAGNVAQLFVRAIDRD
jgi:predicted enzyme related to lactoylglutathione lyase